MQGPRPTRLFHITAMANLPAICAAGALLSKSRSAAEGIAYQNIAYAGAQGTRARRLVPDPPGGCVHDFVPFLFRAALTYAGGYQSRAGPRMQPASSRHRAHRDHGRGGCHDGSAIRILRPQECGVDLAVLVMTSWYF